MCNEAFAECGSPVTIEKKDRYQEAVIGFMKGVEEFDPEKGFMFTTIAGNCIKNHVINYIKSQCYATWKKFPVKKYSRICKELF